MQRSKVKEGPAALSAMIARRNVQRAHVVALVRDAEEVFYFVNQMNFLANDSEPYLESKDRNSFRRGL
jgi:hypothetical protein